MHHLIVTDLDGTLLTDDHVVTPATINTFRALSERGYTFVIASGRHYIDVRGVRQTIGIPAYIISSNGARVHGPDDALICECNIDAEVVRALLNAPLPTGIIRNVFTSLEWLIDRESPDLQAFNQDSGFRYRVSKLESLAGNGVAKLLFVGNPAQLSVIEKAVVHQYDDYIAATYSLPDCLELMAQGVSKGVALRTVMKMLDVSRDAVMAFGDNLNDIEMLRVAGKPHVMGNANPMLFEMFPNAAHIGRNTEDAVAAALRQLLIKKMGVSAVA